MYGIIHHNMFMFIVSTISTVLIMFILFYMKRRLQNLEGTVKDQAKITQNILGMINTMTATNATPHGANAKANADDTERKVLAGMMGGAPPPGLKTSIFCTKLSEPNASEDTQQLFESSSFPYMSEISATIGGMIVVSDVEDNEKVQDDSGELRFQEIEDDDGENEENREKGGNDDDDGDGAESVSTEVLPSLVDGETTSTHPYEHMKVSELRSLTDDRGIFVSKGKLKKEIIQLLEEHDRETHAKHAPADVTATETATPPAS